MQNFSEELNVLLSINGLIGLLTLSVLEIILGIDNIIFISIAVNKLPKIKQSKARTIGLTLALVVRTILLFFIGWIAGLKDALFTIGTYGISGKALILAFGGIFLIYKTIKEIHEKITSDTDEIENKHGGKNTFGSIILQIIIIDFVFSFDSILAAVGVSGHVLVMILAVVISMILMILFSGSVADFINKNPGIKTIALSFLLIIGFVLLIEGSLDIYNYAKPHELQVHLNKNYVYFALGFSLLNEWFNMRENKVKRKRDLGL